MGVGCLLAGIAVMGAVLTVLIALGLLAQAVDH